MATPATRLDFDSAEQPDAAPTDARPRPAPTRLDAWLDRVCTMIPQVAHACVVFTEHGAAPTLWPPGAAPEAAALAIACDVAAGRAKGGLTPAAGTGMVYFARPLAESACPRAALVLRLPPPAEAHRETLLKLLRWSDDWLAFVGADAAVPTAAAAPIDPQSAIVDAGLAAASAAAAATAMAAQVARSFDADNASIGLARGLDVELLARSHTASFDARTRVNRDLAAAMAEAVDEGAVIALRSGAGGDAAGRRAHRALVDALPGAAVCSIPLHLDGEQAGALTLVRHAGPEFDDADQARLAPLAESIARVLALRLAAERGIVARLRALARTHYRGLVGPGRIGRKVALALAALAALALIFVPADYRVAAPATLAGSIERTVVAPIDGYVAEAPARAGDAVRTGDLLAVLDTRELEFERRRIQSERTAAEKASRQAVAKMDRAEAAIARARVGKAESQLALLDARIARARIVAPFDGIVIAGDLSRAMGAPVSRGDSLFEIAPLDDYRVELEVDERHIAALEPGQSGRLALTGLPGNRLPFTVERIVGVAEAGAGSNVFKVEAALEGDVSLLRPGMRGAAKVSIGQRPLGWVWTHDLVDRIRILLWTRTL